MFTYQVCWVNLFNHISVDETRADSVDSDSTSSEFLSIGHGHTDNSTLSGGVVGLSRVSNLTDDRGDVDDTTRTLLGGNLEEGLSAVENTRKVAVNDSLPLLGLHAHDKSILGDTSIVDKNIDGSESFDGSVEKLLDFVRLGTYTKRRICESTASRTGLSSWPVGSQNKQDSSENITITHCRLERQWRLLQQP